MFKKLKAPTIIGRERDELTGKIIKEIFEHAQIIGKLHKTITSPRGKYFRMSFLSALEREITAEETVAFRESRGLAECIRHINKLLYFNLIEEITIGSKRGYRRTELGEKAVNAVRGLQRKLKGKNEDADLIFRADFGTNSIQLFLKIYGSEKEMVFDKKRDGFVVRFKPREIGRIAKFLPRSIDGTAAIDKLDDAKLVFYEPGDGKVYVTPRKARAFYQYLKRLHSILKDSSKI